MCFTELDIGGRTEFIYLEDDAYIFFCQQNIFFFQFQRLFLLFVIFKGIDDGKIDQRFLVIINQLLVFDIQLRLLYQSSVVEIIQDRNRGSKAIVETLVSVE